MNIKLLFADDSVTMQKVIQLTLENEDVDLDVAGNGNEALESLQVDRPDIIIADISMPVMDGFELCRQIKGSPETEGIPVILISGELEKYDAEKGEEVGADGHITKPFKSQEFINTLYKFVDNKAVKTAPQSAPVGVGGEALFEETSTAEEEDGETLSEVESSGNVLMLDPSRLTTSDSVSSGEVDDELEIIDYTSSLDDDLDDDDDDDLEDLLDEDIEDEFSSPFDSTADNKKDVSLLGDIEVAVETGDFITDRTEEFVRTLGKGDRHSTDNIEESLDGVHVEDKDSLDTDSIVSSPDAGDIGSSLDAGTDSAEKAFGDEDIYEPEETEGDPLGKNPLLDFQKDVSENNKRVLDVDKEPVIEPIVDHADGEIETSSDGIVEMGSDAGLVEVGDEAGESTEIDFDSLLKAAEEHVESVGADSSAEAGEDDTVDDLLADSILEDTDIDSMWDDAMKNTGAETEDISSTTEDASINRDTMIEDTASEPETDMDALWDYLQKQNSDAKSAPPPPDIGVEKSEVVPPIESAAGMTEGLESAVKSILMEGENEILKEAIRKAIDQSVKSVIEKHVEESLKGEISAMVGDSFKSAMPEMLGMVEKITAQVTPKIAEQMIKNAIDEIKKGE